MKANQGTRSIRDNAANRVYRVRSTARINLSKVCVSCNQHQYGLVYTSDVTTAMCYSFEPP